MNDWKQEATKILKESSIGKYIKADFDMFKLLAYIYLLNRIPQLEERKKQMDGLDNLLNDIRNLKSSK